MKSAFWEIFLKPFLSTEGKINVSYPRVRVHFNIFFLWCQEFFHHSNIWKLSMANLRTKWILENWDILKKPWQFQKFIFRQFLCHKVKCRDSQVAEHCNNDSKNPKMRISFTISITHLRSCVTCHFTKSWTI